jgi:hypothetical protein
MRWINLSKSTSTYLLLDSRGGCERFTLVDLRCLACENNLSQFPVARISGKGEHMQTLNMQGIFATSSGGGILKT